MESGASYRVKTDSTSTQSARDELYRMLPSVGDLLLSAPMQRLLLSRSHNSVVHAARSVLQQMREEIAQGAHSRDTLFDAVANLPIAIERELNRPPRFSLRPVINATGVILHTNLGRAPLSELALRHLVEVAAGYCNLEFDFDTGERGSRDVHVESLILALLAKNAGTADAASNHRAIVVNNCAAATFLALHALAMGREVIVSRGELVEIGGGFRIPEILAESGAVLKEVGTTNRTRLSDYQSAISPNTGLILRVHRSNFSMEGFVEQPGLRELIELGKCAGIPVFHDQGTGLIQALESLGVDGEPLFLESLHLDCDLVAASGDKLLGGPQCGILVGRTELVNRIRANPLFRALRVDKLTYAALEATLAAYLSGSLESIPILRMLSLSAREIRDRCEQIVSRINSRGLAAEVIPAESVIGGGSAPRVRLDSFAVTLRHENLSADDLLAALRHADPPIVGRIADDRVLLDLRTVDSGSDGALIGALNCLRQPEPTFVDEARGLQ
jgi:L-seryl-tRNA(Ser) seleniumtransferase